MEHDAFQKLMREWQRTHLEYATKLQDMKDATNSNDTLLTDAIDKALLASENFRIAADLHQKLSNP